MRVNEIMTSPAPTLEPGRRSRSRCSIGRDRASDELGRPRLVSATSVADARVK
jgi:hypothetical protein